MKQQNFNKILQHYPQNKTFQVNGWK